MYRHRPTVRLHLWLECEDQVFFGTGRTMLLDKIEEHGSLQRAAKDLGMSYRAAWGKLRATEKALGVELVEYPGAKRDGCRLSDYGRLLRDKFAQWFDAVEEAALASAEEIFPWPVKSFAEKMAEGDPHAPDPGHVDEKNLP